MEYRSTEVYSARSFLDMGFERIEVSNSSGMVVAILTPEEFASQYDAIVEVTPHE